MDIQYTKKDINDFTFELEIKIPVESFKHSYDLMLKDYAKDLDIKGFRKGKVPTNLISDQVREVVKFETFERLAPMYINTAINKEKLIYEEYIRKPLGNRIDFDFNSRILLIDGEKWFSNGYGLGTKEVSPSERTWYYIGQIASLKNVMNNHKNSDIKSLNVVERPIAFLNNKINNNQTLIYIKLDYKNGDSYTKLIDKFDIDYNRVATLLSYKTSPINNEEKYFFYELSYLKKLLQN